MMNRPSTATVRSGLVFGAVLAFFFTSGACGLVYQVAWTRELALLLGARAYAVSLVLSIFFLGLGAGSLWGGRLADRVRRPLLVYALFEVLIGLWAVAFLGLTGPAEGVVVAALRAFEFSWFSGVLLRGAAAFALLIVPVTLMGATLPLLSRFVADDPALNGRRVGALYTLNTLGAMSGCFLAGFVLLQRFGYTRTTLLAAGLNLAIGAAATLLSRLLPVAGAQPGNASNTLPGECGTGAPACLPTAPGHALTAGGGRPAFHPGLFMAAFAVTGFTALALEVLWTRLLAMVFLGTTYAYTTMLTTLLCGLALGGLAGSAVVTRIRNAAGAAGMLLGALAVAYLLTVPWFAHLPAQFLKMQESAGHDWDAEVRVKFLLAFATMFPATFLSGALFPVLVRAVAQTAGRVGRDVGGLYAANTLGGVLGAAAGGFALLPALGAQRSMEALALLPALAGLPLLLRCPATSARVKTAAVLVLACGLGAAGVLLPQDLSRTINASYMPADHEVLYCREGVEGTVAVSQPNGEQGGTNRVLWINRVQATTSIERGVKMNRLQGALPLLFDRDPREVLFMCFGSGITCGTLALSGFDRIDAVEISPDVLDAAPYFTHDNLGVTERKNVNFIIDDGRNHLLRTKHRYDFITFEPMPMAVAGVASFYTREYYQLCLSRLNPGGMVSQWVPMHGSSPEIVRSLARTFTGVFPEYCAFFVNADLFLVGSDQPLKLDYAAARRRLAVPELAQALAAVGLPDAVELMGCFVMDKPALAAFADGGAEMTDDLPWAEYTAPKLVYARKVPESLDMLKPRLTSPLATMDRASMNAEERAVVERRHRSRVSDISATRGYYGGMVMGSEALDGFIDSLRIDSANPNARFYLMQVATAQVRLFKDWKEPDKAEAVIRKVLEVLPDAGELRGIMAPGTPGE
jgi:spermidine synthase